MWQVASDLFKTAALRVAAVLCTRVQGGHIPLVLENNEHHHPVKTLESAGVCANASVIFNQRFDAIFQHSSLMTGAAQRSWRRLNGHNQLPKIILGARFTDGIEVARSQAQAAAA